MITRIIKLGICLSVSALTLSTSFLIGSPADAQTTTSTPTTSSTTTTTTSPPSTTMKKPRMKKKYRTKKSPTTTNQMAPKPSASPTP